MHRVDLCWEIVQQEDSDWLDSVTDCDSSENACNCAELHYCLMLHHLFDYPFYFANLFNEFQMNSLQEPRRELKSGCHERKSSEYVWGSTQSPQKRQLYQHVCACVFGYVYSRTICLERNSFCLHTSAILRCRWDLLRPNEAKRRQVRGGEKNSCGLALPKWIRPAYRSCFLDLQHHRKS